MHGGSCISVSIKKHGTCRIQKGDGRIYTVDSNNEVYELNKKLNMKIPGHDLGITLEAPLGSGLGTSAATSILVSAAIAADEYEYSNINFEKEELNEAQSNIHGRAHLLDEVLNGKTSSADVMVSYFGGLFFFKGGFLRRINPEGILEYKIMIYNSKIKRNTKNIAASIEKIENRQFIYENIEKITEKAYELLDNLFYLEEIYDLIRLNQDCLEELGVVPEEMKAEVLKLRKRKIESKITGSGMGGFLFTLVKKNEEIEGWQAVEIDFDGFALLDC